MTVLAHGLAIDETSYNSPNYSAGRPSGLIGVTIHWWGLPEWKQSFHQVAAYLCQPRGAASTSAHYVVDDTRVACLVSPGNRAWHALAGNEQTVGLELDPNGGAGTLENAAQIIAMLEEYYGVALTIYPHHFWTATQCPGHYADRLEWLAERVNQIRAGQARITQAAEKVAEEITKDSGIMEEIMSIFKNAEEFKAAVTEAVRDGIKAEFTPGQAGVKHAGVGYLLHAQTVQEVRAVHDLLTPGKAGVKHQGAVDAKLSAIQHALAFR